MSATIEGKISFDCPSCAAHLQVPARLAGVTGPCPKCGATIVAPNQSVPESDQKSGSTASHHNDPGSGKKKGFTSLRRRRTRVETPARDLQGITSLSKRNSSQEEVETPFSSLAGKLKEPELPEEPTLEEKAEEIRDEESVVAEETPVVEETSKLPEPEVKSDPEPEEEPVAETTAPEPEVEESTVEAEAEPEIEAEAGIETEPEAEVSEEDASTPEAEEADEDKPAAKSSSFPSFLSGGMAGMAFPSFGKSKSAAKKQPIDLKRSEKKEEPVVEEPELKSEPEAEIEAPEETPSAEVPPSLDEPKAEESKDDAKWLWDGGKELNISGDSEETQPEAESKSETPTSEQGDTDQFEWLLSDDQDEVPGTPPSLGGETAKSSDADDMVDLEHDLDEMLGRKDDAESDSAPEASSLDAFPKWSSLHGGGAVDSLIGKEKAESKAAPETPPALDEPISSKEKAGDDVAAPSLKDDPWTMPSAANDSEEKAPPLDEEPWQMPAAKEAAAEKKDEVPPLSDDWKKGPDAEPASEAPDDAPPPLAEEESEKPAAEQDTDDSIPVMLRSSQLREGSQPTFGQTNMGSTGDGLSIRARQEAAPEIPEKKTSDFQWSPPGMKSEAAPDAEEKVSDSPEVPAEKAPDLDLGSVPWLSPGASTAPLKEDGKEEENAPPVESEESTATNFEPSGSVVSESAPAAATETPDEDTPPPISKLPRFLGGTLGGGLGGETESSAPPVSSSAPALESPSESAPPIPDEPTETVPPLAAVGDFSATSPIREMEQSFGDVEPPRPGDRATAPGQQIRLPQIVDRKEGDQEEKAIVSPITGEKMPPFAPLDENAETVEPDSVSQEEPPKLEADEKPELPGVSETKAEDLGFSLSEKLPMRSRDEESQTPPPMDLGEAEKPAAKEEKPETADSEETKSAIPGQAEDFISARAKAAASSISLGELSADESPKSDLASSIEKELGSAPPVTPEVVSVPGSDRRPSPFTTSEPSATPPLDVETEDENDDGPESEGLAKVLGLLPRERSNRDLERQKLSKSEKPEAKEEKTAPADEKPKAEEAKKEGQELPSIDDVLEGRGRTLTDSSEKHSWIDGVKNGLGSLDKRQKTIVIGGAAAAGVAMLGVVSWAAGWIGGESDTSEPGTDPIVVSPVTGGEGPAGESGTTNPETSTPKRQESPEPAPSNAAGGGESNRLVIVDPNAGKANNTPAPPTVAETVTPAETPGQGDSRPPMTSLIPDEEKSENLDKPADVASEIAWAGGPLIETGGTGSDPVGNGSATNLTSDSGDLVMPTVGSVDTTYLGPDTVGGNAGSAVDSVGGESGSNFKEIAGVGEGGAAPTGTPTVAETTEGVEKALERQEENVMSVAPIDGGPESGDAATAKEPNMDDPIEASKYVLQQFLAQPTWEDRLEYIYDADRLRPRIEAYYQTAKDGAVAESVSKFFDMDERPADGGDPFYAFYLFLEGVEPEFPVVVRKTSDGYKVDWELYVECKDRLFAEFRDGNQSGPATFRLVMQRHSYWGPDRTEFANSNDYLCYQVRPPYPDAEAFVFVEKNSAIATELERIATWGLPPVDVVLTLERKEFPHGVKHFVVKSLDKESWVAP